MAIEASKHDDGEADTVLAGAEGAQAGISGDPESEEAAAGDVPMNDAEGGGTAGGTGADVGEDGPRDM